MSEEEEILFEADGEGSREPEDLDPMDEMDPRPLALEMRSVSENLALTRAGHYSISFS